MNATKKPPHLYIVATDRRVLYASLRRQFADDPNVEIIFDRRRGARRGPLGATPAERRRADRRRMEQEHLLRTLGVVLVTRSRPARTGSRPRRGARGRGARPVAV